MAGYSAEPFDRRHDRLDQWVRRTYKAQVAELSERLHAATQRPESASIELPLYLAERPVEGLGFDEPGAGRHRKDDEPE